MAKSNVPSFVWRRRQLVLKAIERKKAEGRPCPRCDGHGYMDREDWIETEDDGAKACFNCKGSGLAKERSYPEPLAVRKAVAYELLPLVKAGDFTAIIAKEDERRRNKDIYFPVLVDVFHRAINAAERVAGA